MASFPTLSLNPEYPLKEDREDAVIRTPMEGGYQVTRRRFTRTRRKFTLTYKNLVAADVVLLRTFYDTTTAGGSVSFDWTNPADSVTYVCRFSAPLSFSLDLYGDEYRYSTEIILEEV